MTKEGKLSIHTSILIHFNKGRERDGRKEARGRGGGPCKEALGRREVQAEEGAGKVLLEYKQLRTMKLLQLKVLSGLYKDSGTATPKQSNFNIGSRRMIV
ncbi:hypothetical protein CNAG_07644 [Cryptococcus neoformans var. grubii H99]|uniref:Uncharacterized protein n=1 Tax=Cryptococcus neoformans (strain H99 / ATCC 208821 / CBS 10515 / FGSC 9487) TaxID=235443 RepID=J9VQ86_CRYN9|nr:hypothetical protein CNAG_07644 [Cryptococcus neoformans var. grubii H99]AFR95576.1 hypothetical protein CNAG_07644 [Cryptococcus neoformans var. grubii H99]AUB25399.1 hypothetical protein CKF44_07644 [Cryptococcus neoformans var. grubii]|eukprot:XP_012050253.1 hypothetical protein CNAG_07644 [Cryptococcus neoformans var. grubii H99]